jgi:hypothetical protein
MFLEHLRKLCFAPIYSSHGTEFWDCLKVVEIRDDRETKHTTVKTSPTYSEITGPDKSGLEKLISKK